MLMRLKQLYKFVVAGCILAMFNKHTQAQKLTGIVIDQKTGKTIPRVHVINIRNLKGTLSDNNGTFEISLQFGDTIVFSNIAYKYFYFIYSDSSSAVEAVSIFMEEQNYLLNEVSVFSYKLTSNDPKEIKLNKPDIPNDEEIDDGRIIEASPRNPAEYLYNLFGSRPRQLRKLAELKIEDHYRKKLKESNNRKSVIKLTGLSREELEALMFYCKFIPVKIRTFSDYEFLKSVQYCFWEYVKEKELDDFLQQFN